MNSVVTQRFIKCHDKLREENRVRSSRAFAVSLDYLPQSLSEIIKGRRDVTIELIRKAVEFYKINPAYLFTGEGPMFMTDEDQKNLRVLTIVTNAQNDERIVHVPIPAQTGYAVEWTNPNFIKDLPTYSLPEYKYKVGTHRSFDVSGDAMEPTLQEGDKVVCSYLEPALWDSALKDNHVYVVVTKADVMVRRVLNRLRDHKVLELLSDNNFYQPFRVSISDVREVWYVRSKISAFMPSPDSPSRKLPLDLLEIKSGLERQSHLIQKLTDSLDNFQNNDRK
ncbi:MAG: peptidase S24 [Lewinellaceae bacterium]|nr:peptidase S24 [Lewinella sp.]MCB9279462.1 peptidase S24 [Lewinellaceae bacterium]